MLRKYCLDTGRDWDEGVPMVLFAAREMVQDSLGFSPAELIFGHTLQGPLKVLKEPFRSSGPTLPSKVVDSVSQFRERLQKACSLARSNLCLTAGNEVAL